MFFQKTLYGSIWYTRIKNEKKYFVFIPIFLVNRNKFGNSIFSVWMNL